MESLVVVLGIFGMLLCLLLCAVVVGNLLFAWPALALLVRHVVACCCSTFLCVCGQLCCSAAVVVVACLWFVVAVFAVW